MVPHIGFTVPRALGKAVVRNRIRRRVREAVRLYLDRLNPQWSIVINPRRKAFDAPMRGAPARSGEVSFSAAMDRNRGRSAYISLCLPLAALRLPLLSDLFGIHARGGGAVRRGAGDLDGAAPAGALPSVSTRRVRSRPVNVRSNGII